MKHDLLNIQHLNLFLRTYAGEIQAIHNLNFCINAGEIVGLVGESGCGKSLTVQAILQLLPSEVHRMTGEIKFEGQNLLVQSEKALRQIRGSKIGFVAQDPSSALNPTLRIETQLSENLLKQTSSLTKKEAMLEGIKWLQKMRIGNPEQRLRQYPHELSGGMKQRIAIAMALINKPSLLLADEPTTALDVTVQADILALLKELRTENQIGILLITHDLGVVANCCDRMLVMHSGRIVEAGLVDEIFANPLHPYTQSLLQSKQNLMLNEAML